MTRTRRDLSAAIEDEVVVLDGGLATLLETHGHDLTSSLWSARLLRDDPQAIVTAHREYFAAGAQVATSASYQASFEGFAALGIDEREAQTLMLRSIELARQARDEAAPDAWVAASVGPYGAVLADGSEYTGRYGRSVRDLRDFHRRRLEILVAAEPDCLAVETIPCAAEVEALAEELRDLDAPAWISVTIEGDRTRAGEPLDEVFAIAADVPSVFAVGVNCCSPEDVLGATRVAARYGPVIAYPNSGQTWDATARAWRGESAFEPGLVQDWIGAGARLVGGCCRVGPGEISALATGR